MAVIIQWRRDTAAAWTATNPILAQGEAGLELDTDLFKLGDGTSTWGTLGYANGAGGDPGGATLTGQALRDWTESGAYEVTSVTFDTDQVPTTATVKWPDGSAGTYTTTTKNTTWFAVDAYTITHTASGQTVTQSAVTRDSNGNVTIKPALGVA